uniref:Zinc finger protein 467 n=1 Tax=Mus musculus TaxID=10090 RepID=S4R1N3_MOUSE
MRETLEALNSLGPSLIPGQTAGELGQSFIHTDKRILSGTARDGSPE